MTQAEDALVTTLKWAGLPDPVLELKFHPTRRWRFDLAWPDLMIACEMEGGTWVGGGHVRGAGYELNAEKYSEAAILGWLVIRVTPRMVGDGRAVDFVERAFQARKRADLPRWLR